MVFTYTARNGKQKQVILSPKQVMLEKVSYGYTWKKIKQIYQISNDKLNQIRESDEWIDEVFEFMRVQYNPLFTDIDERLKVRRQLIKLQ